MESPIILLSGGTGVGTSTCSLELAKLLNIPTIVSTDFTREVIRSIMNPNVNPTLEKSTYTAGKTTNYKNKSKELQKAEILRAYKIQCSSVNVGIEAVIKRALNENKGIIIEGVHLIPGKIKESEVYTRCKDKLKEYLIHISDLKIHKNRFIERQKEAPNRELGKYTDHFKEIRWIHDYTVERAGRFEEIESVDNSGSINSCISKIMKHFYSKNS